MWACNQTYVVQCTTLHIQRNLHLTVMTSLLWNVANPGGQRTLVSVALLLGLALALGSPGESGGGGGDGGGGGLFLLDEVDAALDEHNQAAVVSLLRHLSHRGGGCQVGPLSGGRADGPSWISEREMEGRKRHESAAWDSVFITVAGSHC